MEVNCLEVFQHNHPCYLSKRSENGKKMEGVLSSPSTPLWRISLLRRWKSSGDPIQGSVKAHVVTHVSLHPCQTIGTASDSGNNATSLWSNLAEKYKKKMLRSHSCHRSYWNWWHRYSGRKSKILGLQPLTETAIGNWAKQQLKSWSLCPQGHEVSLSAKTHENIQERSNPRYAINCSLQRRAKVPSLAY